MNSSATSIRPQVAQRVANRSPIETLRLDSRRGDAAMPWNAASRWRTSGGRRTTSASIRVERARLERDGPALAVERGAGDPAAPAEQVDDDVAGSGVRLDPGRDERRRRRRARADRRRAASSPAGRRWGPRPVIAADASRRRATLGRCSDPLTELATVADPSRSTGRARAPGRSSRRAVADLLAVPRRRARARRGAGARPTPTTSSVRYGFYRDPRAARDGDRARSTVGRSRRRRRVPIGPAVPALAAMAARAGSSTASWRRSPRRTWTPIRAAANGRSARRVGAHHRRPAVLRLVQRLVPARRRRPAARRSAVRRTTSARADRGGRGDRRRSATVRRPARRRRRRERRRRLADLDDAAMRTRRPLVGPAGHDRLPARPVRLAHPRAHGPGRQDARDARPQPTEVERLVRLILATYGRLEANARRAHRRRARPAARGRASGRGVLPRRSSDAAATAASASGPRPAAGPRPSASALGDYGSSSSSGSSSNASSVVDSGGRTRSRSSISSSSSSSSRSSSSSISSRTRVPFV